MLKPVYAFQGIQMEFLISCVRAYPCFTLGLNHICHSLN